MATVYVSIGNSDDKLPQRHWRELVRWTFAEVRTHSIRDGQRRIYGEWFSLSPSRFQNACIAAEVEDENLNDLRACLAEIAADLHQDSIALAIAKTEFVTPKVPQT